MFKALLKKQLLEMTAFLYQSTKVGKKRSKVGIVFAVIALAIVLIVVGIAIAGVGKSVCKPLHDLGKDWLYFSFFAIMACATSIISSMMAIYSKLYEAKDNELVLSMPIPIRTIIITRLIELYLFCLIFTSVVYLPGNIVYWSEYGTNLPSIISFVVLFVTLPGIALGVCGILAFIISKFAGRTRHFSTVVIIISVAFLGVCFMLYSQIEGAFKSITENADYAAELVEDYLFPFYHAGYMAVGNFLSAVIYSAIALIFLGAIVLLLSSNFLKAITTKKAGVKKKYVQKKLHQRNPVIAIFWKEFVRFLKCPVYFLNCGMGGVFLWIGFVALLVKGPELYTLLSVGEEGIEILPIIIFALIAAACSLNVTCAPSISMEGKYVWVLQALPMDEWVIFGGKMLLNVLWSMIPATLCLVTAGIVTHMSFFTGVGLFVIALLFSGFTAMYGLTMNLLFPNLQWTSETAPAKNGLSVIFTLLTNMIITMIIGVIYVVSMFLDTSKSIFPPAFILATITMFLLFN